MTYCSFNLLLIELCIKSPQTTQNTFLWLETYRRWTRILRKKLKKQKTIWKTQQKKKNCTLRTLRELTLARIELLNRWRGGGAQRIEVDHFFSISFLETEKCDRYWIWASNLAIHAPILYQWSWFESSTCHIFLFPKNLLIIWQYSSVNKNI